MANRREAPAAFVAQLRAEFPDFVELRFNEQVGRWEFITLSAAGRPVSQFYGRDRDEQTGAPIEPDPVSGLLPFRDLDPTAQHEILENMRRTFIGNRHDGPGTWSRKAERARAHNNELRRARARERAEDYAYMLQQVDLRRPWVKFHRRGKQQVITP